MTCAYGGHKYWMDRGEGCIACGTPSRQAEIHAANEAIQAPVKDTNPKTAFGAVKPPLGLIPGTALAQEAAVFGLGARKYGAYNWRKNPVSSMTYVHAIMRHVAAYLDGRTVDPESGCSDLAHVRACCAILLDAAEQGTLVDDRPFAGKAQNVMDRLSDLERARQKEEGK